jgi:hypothetical protein
MVRKGLLRYKCCHKNTFLQSERIFDNDDMPAKDQAGFFWVMMMGEKPLAGVWGIGPVNGNRQILLQYRPCKGKIKGGSNTVR